MQFPEDAALFLCPADIAPFADIDLLEENVCVHNLNILVTPIFFSVCESQKGHHRRRIKKGGEWRLTFFFFFLFFYCIASYGRGRLHSSFFFFSILYRFVSLRRLSSLWSSLSPTHTLVFKCTKLFSFFSSLWAPWFLLLFLFLCPPFFYPLLCFISLIPPPPPPSSNSVSFYFFSSKLLFFASFLLFELNFN